MTNFETQLKKLNELQRELESSKEIYNIFSFKIHYNISQSILQKVQNIAENFNTESLLEIYANIRFLLETLINLKLFNIEDRYIYIFYFSIFRHRRNKTKNFISQLEYEIKLLKEFDQKSRELSAANPLKFENRKNLETYLKSEEELISNLDLEFEKNTTIFCKDFRKNGFNYQYYLLETQLIPNYTQELQKINKELDEISKEILRDKIACTLFDFRKQKTRVFKQFLDNRTWKEKANNTNLIKDYDFIYEISSSLIHSTSYSIFTPKNTTSSDKDFCIQIAKIYINNILEEIKILTEYEKITKGILAI